MIIANESYLDRSKRTKDAMDDKIDSLKATNNKLREKMHELNVIVDNEVDKANKR